MEFDLELADNFENNEFVANEADNASGTENEQEEGTQNAETQKHENSEENTPREYGETADDLSETDGADITATKAFAQRLREKVEPLNAELEKTREEKAILAQALEEFGYKGSPQDIADKLAAVQQDTTVEVIRAKREAIQLAAKEQIRNDPEFVRTKLELEALRKAEAQRTFDADLAIVKKLNPEEKVKSIAELGDEFVRLRAAGISTEIAYNAIVAARPKLTPPPVPGKVNTNGNASQEYFTRDEVRAMSHKEIEANLDKIEKSQKTWN